MAEYYPFAGDGKKELSESRTAALETARKTEF